MTTFILDGTTLVTRNFLRGILLAQVSIASCAVTAAAKPAKAHATQTSAMAVDDAFTLGRLGVITLYRPQQPAKQVVLFLSGDGGWNQGVVSMAKRLRDQGALVAGIDTAQYLKRLENASEACVYPPADLEQLSHYLQAREKISSYLYPILVGYSSGATLVYGSLLQAPRGTFAGGLSLGFCPDLELTKPLCENNAMKPTKRLKGKGVDLNAVTKLAQPWQVLQGEIDSVCLPDSTKAFVGGIQGGEITMLPKVGHGYSVEGNWMGQYLAAYAKLGQAPQNSLPPPPHDLAGLPVIEVPVTAGNSDTLVVLLTGDGGWAGLDQELADVFAARGLPVVALNSLKYFWDARTPESTAKDVERIAAYYLAKFTKHKFVLVGYSQGADVLPFVVNRLSPPMRARLAGAAAIGLSDKALFEFHVSNWISDSNDGLPVAPEVAKLAGLKMTCIYGKDERDSLCPNLAGVQAVALPGGHHFNGDYAAVATAVLTGL
jgi:type IV secretory pathway VirJ component